MSGHGDQGFLDWLLGRVTVKLIPPQWHSACRESSSAFSFLCCPTSCPSGADGGEGLFATVADSIRHAVLLPTSAESGIKTLRPPSRVSPTA